MNSIRIVIGISILLLLSGCTVAMWRENQVIDRPRETQVLVKENVEGVFQYQNLSASVLQGKSKVTLNIPSHGIAFLGEQNLYILTQGAAELLSLDELSTRLPLASVFKNFTGIRLRLECPEKDDGVMHFSDTISLQLNTRNGNISQQDRNTAKLAGFNNVHGSYIKQVRVAGVILPRGQHDKLFGVMEPLKKKHNIEVYAIDKSAKFHPLKLAANVVLTPLTAAADIVFFPISLRFLGYMMHPMGR